MTAPHHPRDAGLQAERTALAWSRTALAVLINALLAIRAGSAGNQVVVVLGAILLVAAFHVGACGIQRRRRLCEPEDPRAVSPAVMLGIVVIAWIAAIAAFVSFAVHAGVETR
jgi:uncharacterized membrane protein YidH (DUF202 family)